ncbi:MAG: DNA-binding protein [Opitutaceae bacterium]|nr:DNA-binding protein [Opitutaceae bacterium]
MSSTTALAWSAWQPLGLQLTPRVLAEILDGGQSFRWRQEDAVWTGLWSNHLAQLRLNPGGALEGRVPSHGTSGLAALRAYLRLDTDFSTLVDALPWRSDPHLAACLAAFPGLRLPKQPFGETLLCFLCSATKQIVQIKQMVALLAARHGAPLPGDHRQLPTWDALARIPEPDLRACLLGFRARYIKQTALFLAERPGWLEETEILPYPAAKARLLQLPGVGEKVADCVLLFGAANLEAFPVDTWILKALTHRYQLSGWTPTQLAQFGRAHFGETAGFAQQFLFAHERAKTRL